MLYFIAVGDLIKIGYSDTPQERVSVLQTSNPKKLKVLLLISGTQKDEIDLHHRFEKYRRHGEWFRINEEIMDFVRECIKAGDDRRYEFDMDEDDFKGYEQLRRIRTEKYMSAAALAKALKVSRAAVSKAELSEARGALTIKTMSKYAETMRYRFEYRFVKKEEI